MLDPTPTQTPTSETPKTPTKDFGNTLGLFVLASLGIACLCGTVLASLLGIGWAFTGQPVAIATLGLRLPTQSPATAVLPSGTPPPPTPNSIEATTTAQANWPVVIQDSFDQNTNNWTTVDSNTSTGNIKVDLADGKYHWDVTVPNQEYFVPAQGDFTPVDDFLASINISRIQGSDIAFAGLVFRSNNAGLYVFMFNNRGEYNFSLNYKGKWTSVKNWTQPNVRLNDSVNKLTVSGSGSHFVFYINDQFTGEADDTHLPSGVIGLALDVSPDDKISIDFDDFELRAPAYGALEAPAATAAAVLAATNSTAPLALEDNFNSNEHGWSTEDTLNNYLSVQHSLGDGKYAWTVTAHQGVFWKETPNLLAPDNFYYTVDVQKVSGPVDADYGVVFRNHNNTDLYYFGIDGLHNVYVSLRLAGEWTRLLLKPNTLAIQPGQVNHLGVIGEGSHFTFFINDQYVGEVEDNHLSYGYAGLAMDLLNVNDTAEFEFSHYQLRNLKALGTVVPTPTATRTTTPGPSPTKVPTHVPEAFAATQAAVLVATQAAVPLSLTDRFTSNTNGWTTGKVNDDYISLDQTIDSGKYDWKYTVHQGLFMSETPKVKTPDNFYYTVDVLKVSGPSDADYGLVFRKDPTTGNAYYFGIDDQKNVLVSVLLTEKWTRLLSRYDSAAVQPGEVNHLGVVVQGPHFTFYVNDQYVGEVDDTHLSHGYAGVAMSVQNPEDTGEYVFSNYQVRSTDPVVASEGIATPVVANWPLRATETFSAASKLYWPTGKIDHLIYAAALDREVVDDVYRWAIEPHPTLTLIWSLPLIPGGSLTDLSMEADVQLATDGDSAEPGLLFKCQENDHFTSFVIDQQGRYAISVYDKIYVTWKDLVKPTKSAAVKRTGLNHLSVTVYGAHFTFYVNDQLVTSASNDCLDGGLAGLAVVSPKTDAVASIDFDNFVVRVP
jgi:hypothetical protein